MHPFKYVSLRVIFKVESNEPCNKVKEEEDEEELRKEEEEVVYN